MLQNDSTKPKQTIRIEEIHDLDLPVDIRQDAVEFYLKVFTKRSRGKNRKMMIVYALEQTYLNRGEYFDVVHLGALVGLNESDSEKSRSACLKNSSLYDLPEIHTGQVEPLAMIKYYCGTRVLNLLDEDVQQVIAIYDLGEENAIFGDEGKKARVAACVHYWLRCKGVPINQRKYEQAFPGVTTKKIEDLSYKISFL